MRWLRLGAAVLNQTPLAWDTNRDNILEAIEIAREQEVSVLCLPELCITGYSCEDAFFSRDLHETALEVLREVVPATGGMIVSLGLPVRHRHGLFNTACLAVDGRVAGFVGKQFLPGDGIYYEPRWFKPWPAGEVTSLELDGESHPLGDLYFDCGGLRIGFEICEDAWVAKRPGANLSEHAVDVILNPSASHFAFGRLGVRKGFVVEGSRAFNLSYAYSNLLGNEAGRAIYDGGALIASTGELLAAGPRFQFGRAAVTSAVIDVEATRMARSRSASFEPEIEDDPKRCRRLDFEFPEIESAIEPRGVAADGGEWGKELEFTRAVSLALFDYLRKSRSHGFVVSLSGGADSSAVAVLSSLALRLAVDELGVDGVHERLAYSATARTAADADQLVGRLVTCVYQATENSSERTFDAARGLAEALGARFHRLDVGGVVDSYTEMVAEAYGEPLDWRRHDVALQNIQSRARGPGVWMLANLYDALLLATSNRSEAAVGYATMDGDTCGGLSPIAGIDKAFLRRWLHWMERYGEPSTGPLPALAAVNSQAPTAELRPPDAAQTDEADLMPYDLLDAIERAAIRDKKSPLEVHRLMRIRFPEHEPTRLGEWIELFFRLWCRNQWKRERYAPSFHIDDENLDPKTWCRFPILSGGFERELAKLRAEIAKKA